MKQGMRARIALGCVCAVLSGQTIAQDVTPESQYKTYLARAQKIEPIGEFGEQISLRDGKLAFKNTDIELTGTGPAIRIVRTAEIEDGRGTQATSGNNFGAWELEIPRIKTITALPDPFLRAAQLGPDSPIGWQVTGTGADPNARCTHFGMPGDVDYPSLPATFWMYQWWFGYQLVDDAGNEHSLSGRTSDMVGQQHRIGTTDNWVVDCLPNTANGEPGEAFIATAPDGTKYWFDYLVYRPYEGLSVNFPDMPPKGYTLTFTLPRRAASMLVTKIQDRFGNTVNYTYDNGLLTNIHASDGRDVQIARQTGLVTITVDNDPARTWTYAGGLDSVTRPDGSTWQYSGSFARSLFANYEYSGCSQQYLNEPTGTRAVSVTAPSGAQASFSLERRHFGRSYVTKQCSEAPGLNNPDAGYAFMPKLWIGFALVSKTITGPGLGTQVWSYDYSPHNASWTEDCSGGCQTSVWTDVIGPDQVRTRSTFSNKLDQTENKLLKEEIFEPGQGTAKRTTSYAYATAPADGSNPYPWPLHVLYPTGSFTNYEQEMRWTPIKTRTITQQGVTFTHQITTFDAFARETAAHDYNSQSHSRYVYTAYHDNEPGWVLGQVSSSKVDGTMVSETAYGANDLPSQIKSFGKVRQTLTYYADGMVHTVTDGNGHTTTLSSWKRGIPQSIRFPATPEAPTGATLSAWVSDLGQIDWTEDPDGYRTCYTFDNMGRLTRLTYPSETQAHTCNTSKWSELVRTFAPMSTTEHGLGSGHWKLTQTTGANKQITYFDGLWRPVVTEAYDSTVLKQAAVTRYDAFGRTVFQSYPNSSVGTFAGTYTGTSTTYDALGRVKEVAQNWEGEADGLPPLTTTTSYLTDFQTHVVNPRSKATTTTHYQVWASPSTEHPLEITHPEGAYTSITRDVFGSPTAITRHNLDESKSVTRQLIYNANHELCKQIEPETGSSVVHYDAAGNLDWSASAQNSLNTSNCTDIGSVPSTARVSRTYDARNRLETLVFPDVNGSQLWSYTADGLPAQVDTTNEDGDTTVTNTYAYNHRRLLTGETQIQPGIGSLSLGYAYNANGVLSTITYPHGRMVDYAPNGLGQPTKAGSYATGVSYYPNGGMSGFTYGNGIVHTTTQNARQLPDQSIDSGGVLNDSYDYDANGNVLAISDGLSGANGNRDMSYDDLDRLLTANSPMFDGTMTYSYDVLDNLTHVVTPTRNWHYCYDPSNWQLTNLRTVSCDPAQGGSTQVGLHYDPQGNLDQKNGQAYVFDLGNRLREASGKESYRYDANGRRVASIAQSGAPAIGTIYSYYGQDGVLRFQRDERQGKEIDYITLNGSLVAGVSTPVVPTSVGLWVDATSNTGDYTVNWTAAGSATSYTLQEQIGTGSWTTIQASSATSKGIVGKANGTYHYRAQACSAVGCSTWSNTGTIVVTLPPSQVPVITAPETSTGSYDVTWSASTTATSYKLQERVDGGSWATAYMGSLRTTSYVGKTVATYDYRVQACNTGGCTGYSAVKTVQVLLPPDGTPVVTVPATSSAGSYTVSWTTAPTADSYDLQEYAGGSWTTIQSTSATSRAISGKGNGTYVYRARACNASGCGSWGNQDSIVVTLPPSQVPTVTVPATSYTGSYTVSWTSSATATSYTLQEYAGGSWSTGYIGANLSKAYSGKAAGTYSYRVQACNAGGCTGWSTIDNITVTLPPASAPTISVPASSSTGSYSVSWTGVGTATSYRLDEQVGSGSWTQIQNTSALSRALSGKADGSYSYRVRACNVAGCGGYGATDTIAVLLPPTGIPTVTTPADNYTGSYSVTWTAVTKATSYYLQRKIGSGAWATVYNGANRSWPASGQSAGTYSYQAKACNGAGCATWSAVKTTQVTLPPPTPSSLTGNTEIDGSYRPPLLTYYLYWSTTASATYYELKEFDTVVYSGANTSFITWGRGTRSYYVRACNAAGCSAWKGPLSL